MKSFTRANERNNGKLQFIDRYITLNKMHRLSDSKPIGEHNVEVVLG